MYKIKKDFFFFIEINCLVINIWSNSNKKKSFCVINQINWPFYYFYQFPVDEMDSAIVIQFVSYSADRGFGYSLVLYYNPRIKFSDICKLSIGYPDQNICGYGLMDGGYPRIVSLFGPHACHTLKINSKSHALKVIYYQKQIFILMN